MEKCPIKILHIINSFGVGGMENGLINIINCSDPADFQHEICCIRMSGGAENRLNRKTEIYEVNQPEGASFSLYVHLMKIIKRSAPDIVHTRSWGAIDGIISARLAGVRHIVHGEHGWNIHDPSGRNLKRNIARKTFSFWTQRFVAVSKDISRWLEKDCKIDPEKVVTVINGVDTNKFHPDGDVDSRLKTGFCDPEDFVIGTVGRLDPIKNFDLLIQAFSKLKPLENKPKLLIVGHGSELDNLKESARKCGISDSVVFTGERSDLEKLYPIMDVFVLPSKNEGISNTILEAMACGLPVIASNVGGNPELIDHEESGLLVESGAVSSFVDALQLYMDQPEFRTKMGAHAREKVLNRFSLKQMLLNYENIYKSLVK